MNRLPVSVSITVAILAIALGCVVKDETEGDRQEIRGCIYESSLEVQPDGSGHLAFKFIYEIGIVDQAGVAEVQWRYALVDLDKTELASYEQRMRKPSAESQTALARGERPRTLDIPPNSLSADEPYVLWITIQYRGEVLDEFLFEILSHTAGEIPPPAEPAAGCISRESDQTPSAVASGE